LLNFKFLVKHNNGVCILLGDERPSDIVFAFGLTGDNSRQDADTAKNIAMDTVNELTNSDKISVGASRMDIQPITLFRPIKLTRKKDVLNRLKNAQLVSSNYDVEASLKFVADDLFRLGTGYRFNVPKILILFVNGPQDALPANEAVKKLLENNVKVVTIGVGRKVTEADLLPLVDGDKDQVRIVKDRNNLNDLDKTEITKPSKYLKVSDCDKKWPG